MLSFLVTGLALIGLNGLYEQFGRNWNNVLAKCLLIGRRGSGIFQITIRIVARDFTPNTVTVFISGIGSGSRG